MERLSLFNCIPQIFPVSWFSWCHQRPECALHRIYSIHSQTQKTNYVQQHFFSHSQNVEMSPLFCSAHDKQASSVWSNIFIQILALEGAFSQQPQSLFAVRVADKGRKDLTISWRHKWKPAVWPRLISVWCFLDTEYRLWLPLSLASCLSWLCTGCSLCLHDGRLPVRCLEKRRRSECRLRLDACFLSEWQKTPAELNHFIKWLTSNWLK